MQTSEANAAPHLEARVEGKAPRAKGDAAGTASYHQSQSFARALSKQGSHDLGRDHPAEQPVVLSGWESFLAGNVVCPCFSFCLFLFIMLAITVGGFYGGLKLSETGGEVLSNDIVQLYYAANHLQEQGCVKGDTFGDPVCNPLWVETGKVEVAVVNASRPRSVPGSAILVMYEATGTNCPGDDCDTRSKSLLTERNARAVRAFEDAVFKSNDFASDYCLLQYPETGDPSCLPPTSLIPALFDGDEPLRGDGLKTALTQACDPDNPASTAVRRSALPSFACVNGGLAAHGTPFLRSIWFMGHDGNNQEDLEGDYAPKLWKLYQEQAKKTLDNTNGEVRPLLFTSFTASISLQSLLIHDMLLAVGSFLIVFLYMWFTTESFFLSSMGMTQVVMSCPPAFLVWRVISPDGVGFLQFLTVFLILGIGADDIFVFLDAWKQARVALGKEATQDQVFAAAYRRAFAAMMTTTITTGAAFLFGAFSVIPSVSQFCLFAFFVVLFDFLWCVTFFASSLRVFERFFVGHSCCCFGPAPPIGSCCGPGCCWGALRAATAPFRGQRAAEASADERMLEKLCAGPLFNFLRQHRLKVLAFWLLVTAAGATIAATQLKTATRPAEIGDESNDLVRFVNILNEYYTQAQQQLVQVSWGLPEKDPVERFTSTNPITPRVSLLSNGAESIATSEGQMAALRLCKSADAGSTRCESGQCLVFGSEGTCAQTRTRVGNVSLPSDPLCATGRYCFMEWVEEYATASGVGFPVPPDQFVGLLQSSGFQSYLEEREAAVAQAGRHWDGSLERRQTGWIIDGGKLRFAWATFNASFRAQGLQDVLNDWHDRWEAHVSKEAEGTGARQSSQAYVFMVLQNELLAAAIQGILVSLAVTAVILALVTFNWVLALIGLLNISVITVVFLGVMPLIGWELGANECIFLIAVVGLAVDYTVHLLHAYNEHEHEATRASKMQGALSTMGISVASGAITTMGAGLVLFFCDIAFFQQYGAFIFAVILISLLVAITNLPALILLLGPEGDRGEIAPLFWLAGKLSGCGGGGASAPPPAKEGSRVSVAVAEPDAVENGQQTVGQPAAVRQRAE